MKRVHRGPDRLGFRIAVLLALLSLTRGASSAPRDLLVGNQDAHTVSRYDGVTGTFVAQFASDLGDPLGMAFGPDGNLYVCDGQRDRVNRYDGMTGAFVDAFATIPPFSGPISLVFGPDRNLYVSSSNTNDVREYDGTTGAFRRIFVSDGSGGLSYPRAVRFGADGNLYVASWNTSSVLRYNGTTGVFMDAFIPSGSGGLSTPSGMAFGPGGNLYVAGGAYPMAGVRRYNGTTGAFMDVFASFPNPYTAGIDVAFGPDGKLYVTAQGVASGVYRFDGATGTFVDYFVPAGSGDLFNPFSLTFFPGPSNQPPDCSRAFATPSQLVPPNHRLVTVSVGGVTDPDGDPVSITVTGVTQNEPVDGHGDACPDAVVESDGTVKLRAERSGFGDGRGYVVAFVASDGHGGSCAGTVAVCVPHDPGSKQADVAPPLPSGPSGLQHLDPGDSPNYDPGCVAGDAAFNSLGPCGGDSVIRDVADPLGTVSLGALDVTRSRVVLRYVLPVASQLDLSVYDVAGRRMANLVNASQGAGIHQVVWNPTGAAPGMYFYRLRAGTMTITRSILLK